MGRRKTRLLLSRPCGAKEDEVRKPWRLRVEMLRCLRRIPVTVLEREKPHIPLISVKQWKVRRIMDSKVPARMGICDIVYQEGRWLSFI